MKTFRGLIESYAKSNNIGFIQPQDDMENEVLGSEGDKLIADIAKALGASIGRIEDDFYGTKVEFKNPKVSKFKFIILSFSKRRISDDEGFMVNLTVVSKLNSSPSDIGWIDDEDSIYLVSEEIPVTNTKDLVELLNAKSPVEIELEEFLKKSKSEYNYFMAISRMVLREAEIERTDKYCSQLIFSKKIKKDFSKKDLLGPIKLGGWYVYAKFKSGSNSDPHYLEDLFDNGDKAIIKQINGQLWLFNKGGDKGEWNFKDFDIKIK